MRSTGAAALRRALLPPRAVLLHFLASPCFELSGMQKSETGAKRVRRDAVWRALLSAPAPAPPPLQSCPPAPVAVTSACAHRIDLSVRVKLAEAVGPGYCTNTATQAGEWCTRQWFGVDPSEATTLEIYTNNSLIYYFGALHDDASYTWSGTDDGWEAKLYSLASAQPCSEGDSQCVAFRLVRGASRRRSKRTRGVGGTAAGAAAQGDACWAGPGAHRHIGGSPAVPTGAPRRSGKSRRRPSSAWPAARLAVPPPRVPHSKLPCCPSLPRPCSWTSPPPAAPLNWTLAP